MNWKLFWFLWAGLAVAAAWLTACVLFAEYALRPVAGPAVTAIVFVLLIALPVTLLAAWADGSNR